MLKAFNAFITVITKEIEILTTTIPLILAPTHIIKIGASAVFGKALNTIKNGSKILASIGNSF